MALSYSNTLQAPQNAANPFAFAPKRPASIGTMPSTGITSGIMPQMRQSSAAPSVTPAPASPQPTSTAAPVATGLTADQVRANLQAYQARNPGASTSSPATGAASPDLRGTTPTQPTYAASDTSAEAQQSRAANPNAPASQNTGLFGQLIGQGVGYLQKAGETASQAGQLQQAIAREKADVMGNPYYSGSVKIGRSGIIDQTQGAQLAGLAAQQQALSQQGQAALSGAGLIPEALRYGVGGTAGAGAGTGAQQDPQTQASTYAQDVISGRRTYNDAVSGMGLYGNVGKQFLDQAIRTANPQFNFAQAQAFGATQGQVTPNLQAASVALKNLQDTMNSIPGWQKSSIPLFNSMSNLFSSITGVGLQSQKEKQNAIGEARTQLTNALGVVTNTTPTAYTALVNNWIPDDATPQDVEAAVKQFNTLAENARQKIFGTPGAVTPFSTGAGAGGSTTANTGGEGETKNVGGFNFKKVNGQWVAA